MKYMGGTDFFFPLIMNTSLENTYDIDGNAQIYLTVRT